MPADRPATRVHALSRQGRPAATFPVAAPDSTRRGRHATKDSVLALEASAAAGGDPDATHCALRGPQTPSVTQRLAAAAVLSEREQQINPIQRIAVVGAAVRWLALARRGRRRRPR